MSNSMLIIDELRKRVRLLSGEIVIDLGCGDGNDAGELARTSGALVSTLDIAGTGYDRRRHLLADASAIPLRSGVVSLSVCSFLIHLVNNRTDVFKEIKRIGRPGGWVAIITLSLPQIEGRFLNSYFPSLARNDSKRYGSIQSLRKEMRNAGITETVTFETINPDYHPRANFREVLMTDSWSSLRHLPDHEKQVGVARILNDLDRAACNLRWPEEKTVILGRT